LSFSRDAFSAVIPWQAAGAEYAGIAPAAIIATATAADMVLKLMLTFLMGNPVLLGSRLAQRG
jgi:hypothetical protein